MGDMELGQHLGRGRAGGQLWDEERQERTHRELIGKGQPHRKVHETGNESESVAHSGTCNSLQPHGL